MLEVTAYFDALYIPFASKRLDPGPSASELYLVSYLACLLSLYDGKPASDWGYKLALADGRPISSALHEAAETLLVQGFLARTSGNAIVVTADGAHRLSQLQKMRLAARKKYLDGACVAMLTLPRGLVQSALLNDDQLGQLRTLQSSRLLFEDAQVRMMHRQFAELRDGLGVQTTELIVPATVWLAYYSQRAEVAFSQGSDLRAQDNFEVVS